MRKTLKKLIAALFALSLVGAGAADAAIVISVGNHHHRHQVCGWHHHHRVCHWG